MKALPKRKGNVSIPCIRGAPVAASMKALPKRKGNPGGEFVLVGVADASMKALPKRKGNAHILSAYVIEVSLNESPSEKEGKSSHSTPCRKPPQASMKALPKRKGNLCGGHWGVPAVRPQ